MKKRIVFLILCCIGIMTLVFASKLYSRSDFKAKWLGSKIQDEIDSLAGHDWAGSYYFGDGFGTNVTLLIAPDSGFLFELHGCLGLYDRNYGSVTYENGNVKLHCKLNNEHKGILEEFVPVSWGERHYLIASNEMIDFCNHVNAKKEPRDSAYGYHLLRNDDDEKKVSGWPDIPEEYKKYLLQKPLNGEIIAVGKSIYHEKEESWKFRDVVVTIDIGKETGLLKGMELFVIEPNDLTDSVIITKVNERTSEGKLGQMGSTLVDPQAGWTLSTVSRWEMQYSMTDEEDN